jgi:hypothetical protein
MNTEILTPKDMDIITNTDTYGNVSNRYVQIETSEIIEEIQKHNNFQPVNFSSANVRKKDKQNKQKHLLIMQADNAEMLDGTNMQLVIFNSSDRSSALKMYAGAYRMVCANGMVLGNDILEPISIRHTNHEWKNSVQSLMNEYDKVQDETQRMIDAMMNRYMSWGDQGRFAEQVAEEIINPIITGELVDPQQMTIAQRPEDNHKDLWRTFNKTQEYMIQGNLKRLIKKTDDDGHLFETYSQTKKISDVQKQIKSNRQLHEIAMSYL